MKIAFVILNYNIVKETIDCIRSIENNIKNIDYFIVIVDNASQPEIKYRLTNELLGDEKVTYIQLDNNLGFAKGNNVGIDYARSTGADFVVCLNNDTLLFQKNFCEIFIQKYIETKAAVIGPKILLSNGEEYHRNGKLLSINEYKRQLDEIISGNTYDVCPIISMAKNNAFLLRIYNRCIANMRKDRQKYFLETADVILHGCCLIFTPVFFDHCAGFVPDTFLYLEEELLYAQVKNVGLKTLYVPSIEIHHLEDVSTNASIRDNNQKRLFIKKCKIDSMNVLIKYLEDNEGQIYK